MVKDEEIHIKRCLDSIKPLINRDDVELIIVDTGSTDNTVEICKQYTNKLYFKNWFNDFSGMRNISISYATGKWLFMLDADEAIEKYDDLESFLDSGEYETTINNTYSIRAKNYSNLKNEDIYALFPTMRFFRNDGKFKYEGTVHNQPLFSKPVGTLDIIIGHYGYITSNKEVMDKKFIRTKTLLEKELVKDPNNLYYLYQLGVSYNMHAEVDKSYEISSKVYKLFKKLDKNKQNISFSFITNHLTNCYALGKYNELIEACKLAMRVKNEFLDAYFLIGKAFEATGDRVNAVKYYKEYLILCENYSNLNIIKDHSIVIYRNNTSDKNSIKMYLSVYYYHQEQYDKSLYILNDIIYDSSTIKLYIGNYLKLRKYEKLKEFYLILKHENQELTLHFISYLEKEVLNLDNKCKEDIYNLFKDEQDLYGTYSQFMLLDNKEFEKKYELANKIIKINTYKKYTNIISNILSFIIIYKGLNLRLFYNLDKRIIHSCINFFKTKHYYEIYEKIDDFVANIDVEKMRIKDLATIKYIIESKLIILVGEYRETGMINYISNNMILFEKYLEIGICYTSQIYNLNGMSMKYEYINDIEGRFLILMQIYKENLTKGNTSVAFKYYKLAAETYPEMADFLKEYINSISF